MLHVAVREFAGGESLLLVLLENGSGCAKASIVSGHEDERSEGDVDMYVYATAGSKNGKCM